MPILPRPRPEPDPRATLTSCFPLTTRRPEDIIVHRAGGSVRVDEFLGQVTTLASRLPNREYVINLATDRYSFLLGFCAATVAGQCTLLPPNRQQQTLRELLADYPDTYIYESDGIGDAPGFRVPADELSGAPPLPDAPAIPGDRLCAVLFTSGSTGKSTAHAKYWETFHGGALANKQCYGLGENLVHMLATVPSQHSWGLETTILLPLFSPVAVSADVPLFPQDIADALARLPEPRALVSSPIHLDSLLQARVDPVAVKYILSATAPMSQALAGDLGAYFGASVTEVFGCSEAGSLASRAPATDTLWRISDPFRFELRNDKVRITAAHLHETVVLHDIIEIVEDRQFRWLGRDQDMINIAGKRGSLAHLNHKLNQVAGVVDGVIFLPSEDSQRLAGLVVAPGLEPSAILNELKQSVDPAFLPRPLYAVPMLPRQETGKLARKMILELFESQRSESRNDEQAVDRAS